MPASALDAETLTTLRDGFGGTVIADGDPGYEEARQIFNAMITRRPAAIAQCSGEEDVKAALAFAAESDLEVAIRGGGHAVAGPALTDGGLTIDLRRMNSTSVDPEARTITVGGGALWKDFDAATQPHGLAATGGRISTTGVAGLALGGGSGWLERKFGLSCDNLLSVRLVTADGRTVVASEDENPELFWAHHGAGGNYGIATELTFRLHELPVLTAAFMVWPPEAAPELTRTYRGFAESAPDEVGGGLLYVTGPPLEFVPAHLQGRLACAILVTYIGPEAEAREVIAPLLDEAPEGQMIAEMPYAGLQCMLDDPPGLRNYWSAEYLDELPDAALDAFCARAEAMVVPSSSQQVVFPWGGAVARGAPDSPLASRSSTWVVHPLAIWEDPADDERAIGWTRGIRDDIAPYATGATYLNFTGEEGEDRIVAGYGRENYDRLAALKAEYDPDDVFHLNHRIRPLAEAA